MASRVKATIVVTIKSILCHKHYRYKENINIILISRIACRVNNLCINVYYKKRIPKEKARYLKRYYVKTRNDLSTYVILQLL